MHRIHVRVVRIGLLLVLGLAVTACGDDGATTPTAEQLRGQTFKSTSVEGRELVAGTNVTFDFDDNGVAVNAGCNTLLGTSEVASGALVVGTMAQTMMACTDDLMQQDAFLLEFLQAKPAITLDQGTITLVGQNVSITAEPID